MSASSLRLFSAALVQVLRDSIPKNLTAYKSATPFALKSAPQMIKGEIETPLLVDLSVEFVRASSDLAGNGDAQNAVMVHQALGWLTPAQATDERLWCRLAHMEWWPYMRSRWPIERFSDKDQATRFIQARYFVPQAQSRALLRNGIARLWWAAHLTVDPNRENPYELTDVLLSRLDIAQQILERSIGRSRAILIGFLEFLNKNSDRLLASGQASRYEIRALAKSLNLAGGVSMLDALAESQIIELLERELDRISANERGHESDGSPTEDDELAAHGD